MSRLEPTLCVQNDPIFGTSPLQQLLRITFSSNSLFILVTAVRDISIKIA